MKSIKPKKSSIWFALLFPLIALPTVALQASDDDDDTDDSTREIVSLDEAIDRLQQGSDEAYVSVEGTPVSLIDDDDYRFAIGETEVILELSDDDVVLVIGEAIRVTGELEWTDDDDQSAGLLYELDAEVIRDLDGNLIADSDDGIRDDDDDDDDGTAEGLSLDEAIARLQEGWDEAYVSVEGTPVSLIDDDDYRFAIGETEVILELSDDDVVLVIGEAIRVTGELEWADDDDQSAGLLYELDAMWIEDLAGNRIGNEEDDDSNDDRDDDDLKDKYGNRAEGTLAELIDLFEMRQDDDLNVRTTGTLGELAGNVSDDDEDYLFSDESGITVILDLDSRAELSFVLSPGTQLEIIGELERVDDDDDVPAGITYELDAVWVRLVDGTSLDIGQLTPIAGSTISDWMGYFWKLDDDGWYYHPSKGLLFSDHALGDDDWFLSMNREEWIYANREWYPFVYSNDQGWHYLIGSSYGELQHAYSYDEDEWILDFWRKGL